MSDKTGGPAFPHVRESMSTQSIESGMTLREYFAAKAMQSILSRSVFCDFDQVAKEAYQAADAMIKARGDVK